MEEAPPSIQDLIFSLQQATFMAKHLLPSSSSSSNATTTHLHQIHSSLHHAHRHLSAFLSALPSPPPAAESSATDGEPMQVEDGGDDEETTSKCTIDKVEEKMRHCFIMNKRPKRPLSPSAAVSAAAVAEDKRVSDDGFVGWVSENDYDPYAVRLRALDLVYQFHC